MSLVVAIRNTPYAESLAMYPVGAGVPDGPFCRTSCYASVGADDPVAVPKIFALPYGGRLKF